MKGDRPIRGTRVQRRHGDRLSFQIADAPNVVGPQDLETTYVLTSEDDDRVTCIQPENDRGGEVAAQIGFA